MMMTTGLDEYFKCWECDIADGTVGPCHWCGRPICLEHDNQPEESYLYLCSECMEKCERLR